MNKPLKVWNGRGESGGWPGIWRVYVCAYSQQDAVKLVTQAGHRFMTRRELTSHWSNRWGDAMNGIARERGVWVQRGGFNSPVERLI